jgi:hypothetical protein
MQNQSNQKEETSRLDPRGIAQVEQERKAANITPADIERKRAESINRKF